MVHFWPKKYDIFGVKLIVYFLGFIFHDRTSILLWIKSDNCQFSIRLSNINITQVPGLPGVKDQQQQHHVIWILSREKIIEMFSVRARCIYEVGSDRSREGCCYQSWKFQLPQLFRLPLGPSSCLVTIRNKNWKLALNFLHYKPLPRDFDKSIQKCVRDKRGR